MATFFINTDTTTTTADTPAKALGNGDILFVAQQATLAALGTSTTAPGSSAVSTGIGANSTKITINGDLFSATYDGIYAGSDDQTITVGATGSITADDATNGNGILLG